MADGRWQMAEERKDFRQKGGYRGGFGIRFWMRELVEAIQAYRANMRSTLPVPEGQSRRPYISLYTCVKNQCRAFPYIPHRNAGVLTGASQSLIISSFIFSKVIEQPCISNEVM
jgi:hypothetical protein